MDFRPADSFMAWFGPLVLIGLLLWFLFGNSSSHELLCGASATCFRDWVFGLSGWAAAGAAAVTIGSLYKQADAAQKQTDFQLGDSPPTMDILPHAEDPEEMVVRIVNWNRRTILLHSLHIAPVNLKFLVWNIKINGEARANGPSPEFDPPLVIEGWEDRQKRPNNIRLSLIAMAGDNLLIDHRNSESGVVAQMSVLGPKHQRLTLAAKYEGRAPKT